MQNELADFLRYCRLERRLAETTCKAYERDVRACLSFLRERGIEGLAAVRPPDLRAFLAAEAERRPAVGSQTRTVAALKVFFRFCLENEYLHRDPALVLRTPKSARRSRTCSTGASSAGCSRSSTGPTSGSATSPASASATG